MCAHMHTHTLTDTLTLSPPVQGSGHAEEKGSGFHVRAAHRVSQPESAGPDWLLPTTRGPPRTRGQAEPPESTEEPTEPLSGGGNVQ